MAKIKTREVERNSIKTMDRTVAASHRIRTTGAEIRQNVRQQTDVQEQCVSEYSTARTEEVMQRAAWKTEYAAEVGIAKASKYAKQKFKEHQAKSSETMYGNQTTDVKNTDYHESFVPNRNMAIKERWSKTEQGNVNPRSLEKGANKGRGDAGRVKSVRYVKSSNGPKQATLQKIHQKAQEAMRNTSKNSYRAAKASETTIKGIAEVIERSAKSLFAGSKALIAAIASLGSVSVVIIVICCFLGCVMYFSEEGEFEDYTPMIVTVAESQIGNEGGEPFWRWYGFGERVDWCAIFVSWCGEQCGYLDADILPKFAVVGDGAEWFKEKRQWKTRRYTPKAGDIVFFDWENDDVMDHVGIVEKCENRMVYTIEGNSGDVCKKLQYELRSEKICGYGIPVYSGMNQIE